MHGFHQAAASAVCFFSFLAVPVRAETPPDPLRLIPDQADLVFKIERPRQLVEAIINLDVIKQLQTLEAFKEFNDSTNYRRFYQFLAYFEKQMGGQWPDLVDRLAGGGAALGVKFGPDPAPVLLVIQSKDEELLRKFVKLGKEIIESELARQQSRERFEIGSHRNIEVHHLGDGFFAAIAGSALLVSNKKEAM